MEYEHKKYSVNLINGEEVLYVPNKTKIEFFICFPFAIFACCFLSWCVYILGLKINSIQYSLFLMCILVFYIKSLYQYIQDFFFTNTILTNKRILLVRFNKIIDISYDEIEKISYYYGSISYLRPSNFTVLLNSNTVYKVNFIPKELFKEKLEGINQDIIYKNNSITLLEKFNSLYLTLNKAKYD